MTEMTLVVILRRSRRIWPANDEILRFAQNDSKAVSFENLNFEFVSDFDIRISDFMFILSFIFALRLYVYDRPFYE